MRPSSNAMRGLALAVILAALAGCSEYTDRRDLISIQGGNAVQTAKMTQMVDPWPRVSGQRDIAFNGDVMESAFRRYRTGRVTPPSGTGTSSTYKPQPGATTSGAPAGQSTN